MIVDPIAKVFVVRAPDTPGPDRIGHGIMVITTATNAENAVIAAPLLLNVTVRDAFDWSNASVHECTVPVVTKQLKNGNVRFAFDAMPPHP